jgi:hypothetical protein
VELNKVADNFKKYNETGEVIVAFGRTVALQHRSTAL